MGDKKEKPYETVSFRKVFLWKNFVSFIILILSDKLYYQRVKGDL